MKAWDPLIRNGQSSTRCYELSIEAVDVPAQDWWNYDYWKEDNLETWLIFRIIYPIGKEIEEK